MRSAITFVLLLISLNALGMENPHSDQSIAFAQVEKIIELHSANKDALSYIIQLIKQDLHGIQRSILQQDDQFNEALIKVLSEKFNRDPVQVAKILATPAASRFIKKQLVSIQDEPITPEAIDFIINFVKEKISAFSLVPIGESLPSINQLSTFVDRIRFWLRTLKKEQILDENDEFNKFFIDALAKKFSIDPKEAAKIINTPASRRFINEPKTFFSLLPIDIIKVKVGDTNFEQFDNAIARLKLIASQNPEMQKLLLSDVNYVNALIGQLAKEYNLSEFEVALMLNTPASIELFKNRPFYVRRDNGVEFYEFRSSDKIINIIKEHLKKMLKDKSNPNLHKKADDAIRYVKRFLNHPLVQGKQVFNPQIDSEFLYSVLIPIDSIERGLDNFKDRHDGFQDGNAWYRNANVTQEYLDIAIRFAVPIALEEVISKMNLYAEGIFADSLITYTMQKTLAQAFKNKNHDSINFILDIFVKAVENRSFQINKDTFTKYDDRFGRYGDRYTITYPEFINSIITYIQNSSDYAILNKLLKILLASEVKNIVTELLKYTIDQKKLTKQLLHQFISLGVDLNEPDANGQYPLIRAVKSKSASMVAELLATGKINVQICQDGHNALWYVEDTQDMNFADRQGMIDLLKRAGVTEEVEKCVIQ